MKYKNFGTENENLKESQSQSRVKVESDLSLVLLQENTLPTFAFSSKDFIKFVRLLLATISINGLINQVSNTA